MSPTLDKDLKDGYTRPGHPQTSAAKQFRPSHPVIGSRLRGKDKEVNYLPGFAVDTDAATRIKEDAVFEEFQGIPLHPLLVHAAVVFVPLLSLVALLYALLPFSRLHLRWGLFALALIAPGAALFSKLSGTAFADRLESRGRVSAEYVPKIAAHQDFGNMTFYVTSALGVISLLLWWFVRPRRGGERASFDFLNILLAIVTVLAAAASVYYVIRTGDSGAKMVWNGQ